MPKQTLTIISLGLIGETSGGDSFRYIKCEDAENCILAEFMLSKQKKPALWNTFIDMDEGRLSMLIEGYISNSEKKIYVVIDQDKFESTLIKHKEEMPVTTRISYLEAEEIRKKTKGYRTDLTAGKALEVGWREIDRKAKKISFRNYVGKGRFAWNQWYDITE